MVVWTGFGLKLTFLGKLRDWITDRVLADDVQDILDANGGRVIYTTGIAYGFASSEAIPRVVGKSGGVEMEGEHMSWYGVLPGIVKASVSVGGRDYTGYFRVDRGEFSRRLGGSAIELVGILTATGEAVAGVYVLTDEDFSSVTYASISEGRFSGGAFEVAHVREMGELMVNSQEVPRRLDGITETLVDTFLPANVTPDNIYGLVGIYSTGIDRHTDRVDVFPVRFKVVAGDNVSVVKVPIGVGVPWIATGSRTISPPLLGYSFQVSGHVLWKALDYLCSNSSTDAIYVGDVPVSCDSLVPPYVQLEYLRIGFLAR